MSLDIWLERGEDEVFSANITHNLGRMAAKAGFYQALWRADENGITKASQLVGPLSEGLLKLVSEPAKFKALEPSNKWGTWERFVPWVAELLEACKNNPDAKVHIWR